jgi:hypothetical protein
LVCSVAAVDQNQGDHSAILSVGRAVRPSTGSQVRRDLNRDAPHHLLSRVVLLAQSEGGSRELLG